MVHLFSKTGGDEKMMYSLNKHGSDMDITFPDTAFLKVYYIFTVISHNFVYIMYLIYYVLTVI